MTNPSPDVDIDAAPPVQNLRLVFAALMTTVLLAALDQTIVSTALPTITSDLGGLAELSWVVTAYLLASTASTPILGKLSDLYGRKMTLQASVVIFTIGSALAGLSQSMGQLIATRAFQGLGAGGLMVLVMAVVADVVAPRERGRYMGLFGAVFGVASVIGPLLGGLFTQHLSWRAVFYVNVPLGIAAFLIIGVALHLPVRTTKHRLDIGGAALLVVAVVSALLVTVWGGSKYNWTSTTILGLALLAVVTTAAFIVVELRHPEPMVPLSMFKLPVVRIASAIGFVVGFAMFGSIVYLSIFMQVVRGATPTEAGLQLLPLMAGVLITSVISGRLITRTGRYKIFPILGTAASTIALALLSRVGPETPYATLAAIMFLLGAGLGGVMQVLVVAIQNSVEHSQLGAATSASTFFRSIGGSFGTAIFGAVWTAQLATHLAESLPPDVVAAMKAGGGATTSMSSIAQLPPALHDTVINAFAAAIDDTFKVAVPIMAIAFILSLILKEAPLQKSVSFTDELTEDAGVPMATWE